MRADQLYDKSVSSQISHKPSLCASALISTFICFSLPSSSRQQEIEEKLIEEETARRVEELVAKRVEEELEKRKDEIEREVLRRVEEAKRIMERQLLEELERQRQAELAAQKAREVTLGRLERSPSFPYIVPKLLNPCSHLPPSHVLRLMPLYGMWGQWRCRDLPPLPV